MKALLKLLLLIFGTLAIHKSASATAFVLMRIPGGYVLGADSRVVNENDVIQQPTCKINFFANTALILTGPTVGPSFNLRSIGIPILKRNSLGVLAKEAKLYRAASRNVEYQKEVGTLKAFGAGWAFVQFNRVIVREFQNKDGVPNM